MTFTSGHGMFFFPEAEFEVQKTTIVTSSSLHYLSACTLNQGLCYRVEVRFAAKKSMKKHQRSAFSLPVKDIISQVDWTVGRKNKVMRGT